MDTEEQSTTRFKLTGGAFDSLKNIQTREAVKQNFLNLKKLQYLAGFETTNGRINLNQPIWKTMDGAAFNKKQNLICRMVDHEISELGFRKSSIGPPTYNSVFIMRDK